MLLQNAFELGIEYDHDFTYYYFPGCDERFYTFRIYGMYHFIEKENLTSADLNPKHKKPSTKKIQFKKKKRKK